MSEPAWVPEPTENSETLRHAQAHVSQLLAKSPFYSLTIAGICPVRAYASLPLAPAPAARVFFELPLQPHHLNSKNSLHGSLTATLVDFAGGVAIACALEPDGSRRAHHDTGVSVDMSIQYVGGARVNEVLEVEGIAERVGGSLAFTRVVIRKLDVAAGPSQGPLVATASHTKFVRRKTGATADAPSTAAAVS